jgi:diphthine synthase
MKRPLSLATLTLFVAFYHSTPPPYSIQVSQSSLSDPVCATTHTDIMIRAFDLEIDVELIHNASVMGAAGSCGLQLYTCGQTISIPFFEESWRPTSFYKKIKYNRGGGMHTLCLLDIKVKEPDFEAMKKGKIVEQGKHEELLAKKGEYFKLVTMQSLS